MNYWNSLCNNNKLNFCVSRRENQIASFLKNLVSLERGQCLWWTPIFAPFQNRDHCSCHIPGSSQVWDLDAYNVSPFISCNSFIFSSILKKNHEVTLVAATCGMCPFTIKINIEDIVYIIRSWAFAFMTKFWHVASLGISGCFGTVNGSLWVCFMDEARSK